jgi:hypothetical protein
VRCGYWSELATLEKALLALDPISLMVPTTRTRITASMTAYSAMSCPSSSDQINRINLAIPSSGLKAPLGEAPMMPGEPAVVKSLVVGGCGIRGSGRVLCVQAI